MQLSKRLSLATVLFLAATSVQAEDYVSVQYMQYDESNDRVSIQAPHFEINKDFGTDYTVNFGFVADFVSGASPTYHDTSSGASAYSRGFADANNVVYGPIDYDEQRKVGSLSVTKRMENRDELTVGGSFSGEQDFYSLELSGEYLHWMDESKNQAISFGTSLQANQILIQECIVNEACDTQSGASETMTSNGINSELGFTQVIDKDSLAKATLFVGYEDGYLNNPYMNVVRNYDTNPYIVAENRPDSRMSFGTTLKYIKAINDALSVHGKYRFYHDDWDINSHTFAADAYYEIAKAWTIGAGARYYTQSAAEFYDGAMDAFTDEVYASSDERLSDFDAITYKFNVDYAVNEKINLNVGASYYDQGDYFDATYYTVGAKYKF